MSTEDDEELEGALLLVNELLESVTKGMSHDILESAITVLRETIREADDDSDTREKAEVALVKALRTRFACHGWVDDLDEAAARMSTGNRTNKGIYIVSLNVSNVIQLTITFEITQHLLRAMGHEGDHSPDSVAFSLSLLHDYRQSIDTSNLHTAMIVAIETLGSYHGTTDRRALLSLRAGSVLRLKYLSSGAESDLVLARALFHYGKGGFGRGDPMHLIALFDLKHVAWVNFMECGLLQGMSGLQEMEAYGEAAQAEDQGGQDAYMLGSQLLQGDRLGIDEAILQFRHSLSFRPPPHPHRHKTLAQYALALNIRFDCTGQIVDLEQCIVVHREALSLRPQGHPARADSLNNLAYALLTRFTHKGSLGDLEEGISLRREVLGLLPVGDPSRCSALRSLSNALFTRFENRGDFGDLQECISFQREALSLLPPGHPNRVRSLNNLAVALLTRFDNKGDLRDLEECITSHEEVLTLVPPGNPDRGVSLHNMANALRTRFKTTGELQDLDECITSHGEALALHPPGHPRHSDSLNDLANALSIRFDNKGDFRDLEEGINLYKDALSLRPQGHPNRADSLNNLATALHTRFENQGDLGDLEEGISLHKEALSLRPRGHPNRSHSLNNLASVLATRFENKGDFKDLEESIALRKEVVSLRPPGHPRRSDSLNNLATALSTRFENKGDLRDLEECISLHEEVLYLRPPGHPDRAISLSNLARAMILCFENKGNLGDLEKCISFRREALTLFPPGHPNHAGSLHGLASALFTRFENKGDFRDLEECIAVHREAYSLRPPGHPGRGWVLNDLAGALFTRFENKGDLGDLQECISLHREALALFPPGHPDRAGSLNNLACALYTRFKNKGDCEDLEECNVLHREAVSLRPPGHPDRGLALNSLANTLYTRFENNGDVGDLKECISLHGEALALLPPGHPNRAGSLNNLANSLFARFRTEGDLPDLEQAIIHGQEALACFSFEDTTDSSRTVRSHPEWLKAVLNLVQFLKSKHKVLGDSSTLDEVFELLESGAQCHGASLLARLDHVRRWSFTCREFQRPATALTAYAHGISLLPLLASLDLTLEQRQNVLVHAEDLARDAVQCSIEQNELETALTFLSTARSVFWSQALQFRVSFDRLDAVHPDLASELRSVTRQLQVATQQHPQADFVSIGRTTSPRSRPYLLSLEREEIIASIRTKDGFHDFLLPPSPDVLKTAARKGPVVFLNASQFGCNALILKEDGSLSRIEIFTDFNLLKLLVATVRSLAGGVGRTDSDESDDLSGEEDRACRPRSSKSRTIQDKFRVVLSALWENVGEPVISALGLEKVSVFPDGTRS